MCRGDNVKGESRLSLTSSQIIYVTTLFYNITIFRLGNQKIKTWFWLLCLTGLSICLFVCLASAVLCVKPNGWVDILEDNMVTPRGKVRLVSCDRLIQVKENKQKSQQKCFWTWGIVRGSATEKVETKWNTTPVSGSSTVIQWVSTVVKQLCIE